MEYTSTFHVVWEGPEYCDPLFGSAEIKNMPKASDFATSASVRQICMILISAAMESRGARVKPGMSMTKIIQIACGFIFNARGQ